MIKASFNPWSKLSKHIDLINKTDSFTWEGRAGGGEQTYSFNPAPTIKL